LAFTTRAVDAPHRIETPTRLLFRGVPVRAVQSVPANPKVDLDVPDSSHGVHRSPLRRHDRRCVHTRPGRRPGFGSGLPHPERVPFLPFLPASTVSSAEGGSEDPSLRQPAGLLHPAAGHGVHHVSDSLVGLSAEPRPEGRGPEGPGESSPVANTLRSVPLLDSLRPCRHRASSFRTRSRSPAGVPSRRFEPCSLPCRHGALLSSPTSGLSSVEESVAFARRFRCAPARCSLGLWIDSFRCCRAFRAAQTCWTFRLAGQPLRRPRPERQGKARCFGLVWLRATDGRPSPKGGPCAIAVAPAPPERGTSAASHMGPEGIGGMPVDQPGGGSTASVQRPKAEGCRRDRDASPKRLVRDPVLAPKSGTGGSSFCSASLGACART